MHTATAVQGLVEAIAAGIAAAATLGAMLIRTGRREGKVDEILDRLVKLTDRHDEELRELQLDRLRELQRERR